jgi:hypothetical protein
MPHTLNDKRMAWIRNLDKLAGQSHTTYSCEYDIASECYIPGVLAYSDDALMCGLLSTEPESDGLYHYLLRITYPQTDMHYNKRAHPRGYYFKDGIVGELLSLFSLHFQCRFFLAATYFGELSNHGLKLRQEHRFLRGSLDRHVYPKLFTNGHRNFATDLPHLLDRIKLLPPEEHQAFILASYHYARALKEAGLDSEMVFVRLVSAVEALASRTTLDKRDDLFMGKDFKQIVNPAALTGEQLEALQNTFEARKAGLRFVRFVEKYSKGAFKGGAWKAKHLKIKRADLPQVLKRIYSARSAYLHTGEPMYLSQFMRVPDRWDTDPSLGMTIDNRSFKASQQLPYTYWFEILVRICLLNYLNEKTNLSQIGTSGPDAK